MFLKKPLGPFLKTKSKGHCMKFLVLKGVMVSKIPFINISLPLQLLPYLPGLGFFCKYINQLSVWFSPKFLLFPPPCPTFLLPQSALLQSRTGCLKPRFGVRPGIQNNNLNLGIGNTILHHKTVLTTGVQVNIRTNSSLLHLC